MNQEITRSEVKIADVFNKYFVNVVPSMVITNNHNFLSNTYTNDDLLEKIIDKYKNHPSIIGVNKHMTNSELSFTFQPVTKYQISNLIKLLNDKKAVQSTDILTKEFCDFFPSLCTKALITVKLTEISLQTSRKLKLVHFIEIREEQINQAIGQLVFFLMFQKYLKDAFAINYTITLIRIFLQNINVVFVKV